MKLQLAGIYTTKEQMKQAANSRKMVDLLNILGNKKKRNGACKLSKNPV